MFTVAHELIRKFTVTAQNGEIVDIGTRFNVYQTPEKVDVSVLNGSVYIRTDHQASAPLVAGQQLSYDRAGTFSALETTDTETIAAWREGNLVFDMTPLYEATRQLARYHNAEFKFDDPKLKQLSISGSFSSKDLGGFLKTLATIYPITTQIHADNSVTIKAVNRR